MARIGLLGFLHETNTFAADATGLAQFVEADAWPGLVRGTDLLAATHGMNLAISGFVAALHGGTHELAPLLWCSANPSGTVRDTAFEDITAAMLEAIDNAPPLDALFLDLHGAMVTESFDDAEGELLGRLRERLGPDTRMVAALDYHANVSPAMVARADALVAYHSYPHTDMAATGARAARIMQGLLADQPLHAALRRANFLIPMPWQSTLAAPAADLARLARSLESDAAPEVQFIPGFPLSDTPEAGPSVLAYASTRELAEAQADTLFEQLMAARPAFQGHLYEIEQALAHVHGNPQRRIILADTQDNPGGGGTGDTTDILHALLRANVQDACAGILCDAAFVRAAHQAGAGQRLQAQLGGRHLGGPPLEGSFEVLTLANGQFTGTGPFYMGCRMDLGLMARVRLGPLQILVSSRKQQAADQAMFRHLAVQPSDFRVLVLKSSVHFRADFATLADDILIVRAPGENTCDLHDLQFRRLRAGMALL
ncbi:M81 family peptidase [Allopusillimonas soli]|uniref:Microcystinase C n=1 Tax=Allopusillimonas soli TaxID=659016 RepID=A0A853F622_9BURK|nr:M81 family metallopeptidase [Allopusillimonas soli]NYT35429.1 M81 family metallopeptidase [Allopusillimonas soli]TEA75844.1 M81 family peptidase [Allopusillimonas soli]